MAQNDTRLDMGDEEVGMPTEAVDEAAATSGLTPDEELTQLSELDEAERMDDDGDDPGFGFGHGV